MGKRIHPYRVITSNDDRYSSQAKIRWDHTLRFLQDAPPGNRVLEIGERTSLTDMIEKAWNCTITNTNGDLDVLNLEGLYDVVLSFEVLEHLFNPLFHLLQIHQVLTDGGRLFLSTPKGKPYFLWSPEHFHEMGTERLKDLLTRAGFIIRKRTVIRIHPWWFYLKGLRPVLRLFFDRRILMELVTDPGVSS
ncbi:class I SAM-dependent methyltransferase [Candidatus Neomarinimicrobiota bacterium]